MSPEHEHGGVGDSGAARTALAGAFGYLLGTFPTADVVARLAGRRLDLRKAGTGNPGALNAAKSLGAKWGAAVLAGDIGKGALAALAGKRIGSDAGAYAAATGAVFGHCLPVWNRFRGGKGVATSAGTTIVCFPAYMSVDLTLAAATIALSRGKAGMATYVASAAFTGAALLWWRKKLPNLWGTRPIGWLPVYAVATSAVIAYRFLTAPPTPTEKREDE